jgi:hypothetical protein
MSTGPVLNGWQSIAAATNATSFHRPQITQAMLAEFDELRRLDQRKQELRDELLSLLDAGAEIQPGPLSVEVQEYESKTLSFAKLCAIGGEEWAEDIRQRIEPSVSRRLIISSEGGTAYGSRPQAANHRRPRPQGRIGGGIPEVFSEDDPGV